LPSNVSTVSNVNGLLGGIKLWEEKSPNRAAEVPTTR
jgi:hypothetical protein